MAGFEHGVFAIEPALTARLLEISTALDPGQGLHDLISLVHELGWSASPSHERSHPVELGPPLGSRFSGAPVPDWLREQIDRIAHALRASLQTERKLLQLEERLQMLSEGGFEGLFVHRDGVVIEVNERLIEILRAPREQLLGTELWRRCVAPTDLARVQQRMSEQREGTYVISAVRFDGSPFWAELAVKTLKSADPPLRLVGVRDVTENEQARRRAEESELRLRQLVNQAFDVTVFSQDEVIIDAAGSLDSLGLRREAMIGRRGTEFVHPSDVERMEKIQKTNSAGRVETRLLSESGEAIPVEVVTVKAPLGGVMVRVSGIRDLRPLRVLEADRRRLELQVERAQRLDTVGVLAGGIAHDFNNLLVGILGNADLLGELSLEPGQRELVDAIVSAGRRAKDLTSRLLAYSGVTSFAVSQSVHLGALITDIQQLHSFERSRGVRVELEVDPDAAIWGDKATLTQVLLNLISNGVEACAASHGQVAIRGRKISDLDARWNEALGATVGPGDWVLVEIEDSGIGMDGATISRIFEPFFTTKARGHGLGLASCLGIVEGHGGAIHVASIPGRGSCFSLLLPAAKPSRSVQPAPISTSPRIGQILVVDDEPLVRRQLRRSLELQGYETVEAEDGASCLALLEGMLPSLVILDATMPGLSGADVVREIRRRELALPIVLTSGYMDTALRDDLEPSAIDAFLAKPYRLQELLGVVQGAIHSRELTGRRRS